MSPFSSVAADMMAALSLNTLWCTGTFQTAFSVAMHTWSFFLAETITLLHDIGMLRRREIV